MQNFLVGGGGQKQKECNSILWHKKETEYTHAHTHRYIYAEKENKTWILSTEMLTVLTLGDENASHFYFLLLTYLISSIFFVSPSMSNNLF